MEHLNKKTIAVFVPHRGCPNDCIFCNQRKITGIENEQSEREIVEHIEAALRTIAHGQAVELAFFGGSFTAIDKYKQKELLEIAKKFIESGRIRSVRISTRPDSINEEILDFLRNHYVETIELGVQSMDDDVLKASNRGHNSDCVRKASELILKKGFKLGLQMMIGLPQDSETKVEKTVKSFIDMKPHFVRIYPVLIIKSTKLESLFKDKQFIPWDLQRTIEATTDAYLEFIAHGIAVIRMGLQSSDNIAIGKDIIGGAYHPAFGELIYSNIFKRIIEKHIAEEKRKDREYFVCQIVVSKNRVSQLVGINKSNSRFFYEKYQVSLHVETTEKDNSLLLDDKTTDLGKYFGTKRSYEA